MLLGSGGSQDESAARIVEEPQRAQLVPELPVEHGAGAAGEGVDAHASVELRGPGPQRRRGAVPAFNLVTEQQGEEVRVRQRFGPC